MKNICKKEIKRCCGFTLIEIMTAVLFVAIILPAAMQGISIAASLISDARNNRLAVMLAEYQLNEIKLEQDWTAANQRGVFGQTNGQFRWSYTAEPTETEDLMELNLTVYWIHRGYDKNITLTTLVYDQRSR